ncbi:fibronectin type III domain-containing protein [Aquimarina sp. AU474]|uniref:fibronectin type III domain-containing protein n=1 Tax=Aquimarina sp. AU474 TaxID=2108529 RepID=UPI000D687420|nr:hypothetical protein [Aquimarina sp. AU474]
MNIKLYLILISFLTITTICQAQSSVSKSEIKVISRVQKGRILLRWAPNKPAAWKLLNTYGYTISRTTVSRDGKTLIDGETKVLNPLPLSPGKKEEWEEMAKANDNAAIVAQAIFGDTFMVAHNTSSTNPFERIVKKSEELKQRFSFSLLIADQDFEVAQKAGLGFVDTDVKVNEKYLYQVKPNVPSDLHAIVYGGVFTGLTEYEELPKPVDFTASFKDKEVILSWNSGILHDYYNKYKIEKSTDGIHFSSITEKPYTVNKKRSREGSTMFTDSISNLTTFYYRIKGLSSFGELGPPSKIIKGQAKPFLTINPTLTTQKINDKSVLINWEFPVDKNKMIVGFKLQRSDTKTGSYTTVVDNISKDKRSITYDNLDVSNYFKIIAIGKYGKERASFSMLVQPDDEEPPVPPTGFSGVIDTLGVVRLSWLQNREKDLLGYRVYTANNPNHEFSLITPHTLIENEFTDTISMANSNRKVYYKINALDQRANPSGFSEILELVKPDLIPPGQPVIKKAHQTANNTLELSWTPSPSADVENYLIYRKEDDIKEWELIFSGSKEERGFIDTDIKVEKLYSYTIIAKDKTGLESPPVAPVSVVARYIGARPEIKSFNAIANIEEHFVQLNWRYNEDNITQFEIYKAKEEEPLQLYKTVFADVRTTRDTDLSINTNYKYVIRAVFKDGGLSKKTELTIKY